MKNENVLIAAIVVVILLVVLYSTTKKTTTVISASGQPVTQSTSGLFGAIGTAAMDAYKRITSKSSTPPIIAGSNTQTIVEPTGAIYA